MKLTNLIFLLVNFLFIHYNDSTYIRIPLKKVIYIRNTSDLIHYNDPSVYYDRIFRKKQLILSSSLFMKTKTLLKQGHIPLINFVEFQFYGFIKIGTPAQNISVCFDTGSSDFWVPSNGCIDCAGLNRFNPHLSKTFHLPINSNHIETPKQFSLSYGSGKAKGTLGTDNVNWGSYDIVNVSFGLVNIEDISLTKMRADGLLGMGFDGLSVFSHPPLFMQLLKQKVSKQNITSDRYLLPIFSFYLTKKPNQEGSELIIGGYNTDKLKNKRWLYNKVLPQFGTFTYWRLKMHSFIIKDKISKNICKGFICTAIIDTGTSLIGIPSEFYLSILTTIKAHTTANGCTCVLTEFGYQCFLCVQNAFPDFRIGLNGDNFFILTPSEYVICIGSTCLPLIQPTDQAMWILGDVFLKKYYSLYNVEEKTVGFACQMDCESCGMEDSNNKIISKFEKNISSSFQTIVINKKFLAFESPVLIDVGNVNAHTMVILAICSISIVVTFYLMLSYWHYPSLREKRVLRLVFWLSSMIFVYDLNVIFVDIIFLFFSDKLDYPSFYCNMYLTIQQFSGLGIILFTSVINLELLRAVRGLQVTTVDYSRKYHIFIWSACFLSVFPSFYIINSKIIGEVPDLHGPELSCLVNHTTRYSRGFLFYGSVLCTIFLGIYSVKVALKRLRETNLIHTENGKKRARLIVSYVSVFAICYSLSILLGLVSILLSRWIIIPSWIGYINQILFYSHGLLNSSIWLSSPAFQEVYRKTPRYNLEYFGNQADNERSRLLHVTNSK